MDFMLTKNGDLMLEEVANQSHEVGFIFFIKPVSHAICLTFDFEKNVPAPVSGLKINFDICKKEELCKGVILFNESAFQQKCYNAIRSKKGCLEQASAYGSELYLETNKRITLERLENMAQLAKEAISDFAPEATVVASGKSTAKGMCEVCFEIHTYAHTLSINYTI